MEELKVRAAEPAVEVRDRVPVDSVKPLEAVKVEAEVMVPDPVVKILPEVEIESPLV